MKNLPRSLIKNNQIEYLIANKKYIVNVVETNNKNMYLVLAKGILTLKKPVYIAEEMAVDFVNENIVKFVAKLALIKYNVPQFINIDAGWFLLFGKKQNFFIKQAAKTFLIIGNDFQIPINLLEPKEIENAIKNWIFDLFSKKIFDITKKIENQMGAISHKVIIRDKERSWGTNIISKKTISYNSKLAHFDEKYLSYVVIHEVAHSFEPNHSPQFWAIVEHYCPDWKELKNKLNKLVVY